MYNESISYFAEVNAMSQSIKNEIEKIVKEINRSVSTNKIYLFGSFSNGTSNDNSDLDLCIITDEVDRRKRDIIRDIRKSISKTYLMPVDILVYYENEFNERANLKSTIEHKISSEGVSVYEQ